MSYKRRQSPDLPPRLKKALDSENLSQPLKRALEHPRRLEIFIFLMDRPDGKGTSEQKLADAFDMGDRLVEYHLKVLQDADLVANVADEQGPGTGSYVASALL